ncbi:MAG: sigma factor-like helix-turn-helix DNA-binding protein [Oscillospiraceae bacterium]|nr:sigma factor-like helix-turn-helix DNA-binding protein [Oscillospiraceae bacterium]
MELADIVILLDIYGELLANSQRDALDMKYNDDLSLAEIAEEMGGISRQSVLYSIRKGEQKLSELEEKLGFAKRLRELSGEIDQARRLVEDMKKDSSDLRLDKLGGLLAEIRGGI